MFNNKRKMHLFKGHLFTSSLLLLTPASLFSGKGGEPKVFPLTNFPYSFFLPETRKSDRMSEAHRKCGSGLTSDRMHETYTSPLTSPCPESTGCGMFTPLFS